MLVRSYVSSKSALFYLYIYFYTDKSLFDYYKLEFRPEQMAVELA